MPPTLFYVELTFGFTPLPRIHHNQMQHVLQLVLDIFGDNYMTSFVFCEKKELKEWYLEYRLFLYMRVERQRR